MCRTLVRRAFRAFDPVQRFYHLSVHRYLGMFLRHKTLQIFALQRYTCRDELSQHPFGERSREASLYNPKKASQIRRLQPRMWPDEGSMARCSARRSGTADTAHDFPGFMPLRSRRLLSEGDIAMSLGGALSCLFSFSTSDRSFLAFAWNATRV